MADRARHSEQSERTERFVRNMRTLRERKGWSTQRLAHELEAVGCATSRATLTNLENHRRSDITLDEAFALTRVLETTMAWLCDYDGPSCTRCLDNPPEGFSCLSCGAVGDQRFKPHTSAAAGESGGTDVAARWADGEPRRQCTYTCTRGKRCDMTEPRPWHDHHHGHLGRNDCTWTTKAPEQYPHARCGPDPHLAHRWGDPAHWCDATPTT